MADGDEIKFTDGQPPVSDQEIESRRAEAQALYDAEQQANSQEATDESTRISQVKALVVALEAGAGSGTERLVRVEQGLAQVIRLLGKRLFVMLVLCQSVVAEVPKTDKDDKPHHSKASLDRFLGLGAHRDAEQNGFSMQVWNKVRKQGGTVVVYRWIWNGQNQLWVLELTPEGWSGPNAPMGHGTSKMTQQILTYKP